MAAWPARLPARGVGDDGLAAVAGDRLLRALLESAPVCDVELERFLTLVRSALLDMVVTPDAAQTVDVLGLACALARQCFINEYVFVPTEDEQRQVQALQPAINDALETGTAVYALRLVAVATYRSLHSLAMAELIMRRPWPAAMSALIDQQLREPMEEQEIRGSIPALTSIDNEVSRRVRRQYEEMPYPRWVKSGSVGKPVSIEWYLRNQFPSVPIHDVGRRGSLDVLIAGCGTGQHAIETAQRFVGAKVLAIDLSLTSLSYAVRMTRGLDLSNIQYAQADILKRARSATPISSKRWACCTTWATGRKAGASSSHAAARGFMHVGLQRLRARHPRRPRLHRAARPATVPRTSRDAVRAAVQRGRLAAANVAKYSDFFTTSECRDLLFHARAPVVLPTSRRPRDNQAPTVGFTVVRIAVSPATQP